jgi:murein DD-endopeptidase MepM/ murein hydrolase activator NlpD
MSLSFKQLSLNKSTSKLSSILNYKPNFALNSTSTTGGYLVGILSHTTNSTHVEKKSISSSIVNFLYVLLICSYNFTTQIFNKCVYLAFQVLNKLWVIALNTPKFYYNVIDGSQDLVNTFKFTDTRELWLIERKLDAKYLYKLIDKSSSLLIRILQKFYLSFVVFTALLILNTGGTNFTSKNSNSFVSRFLNNRTPSSPVQTTLFASTVINASAVNLEKRSPVVSIIEHTVQEGESLNSLTTLYGLSADTIKYNNGNKDSYNVGEKVYLPWLNGYIYRTTVDQSPAEIQAIYSVNADEIAKENLAILNPQTNKFTKDSLVLIPTTDFVKITQVNNQITDSKRKAEDDARQKLLATQSISSTIDKTSYTAPVASTGAFIFPAPGVITRCLQSGHVACDIANASSPDIVAVQSGVVSDVYRFTVYGYGNAVVVDHGNGLKTLYAHMSQIYVNAGQSVSQGQGLGQMGCTGLCTGTHVHFEVKLNGVNQNPLLYLP